METDLSSWKIPQLQTYLRSIGLSPSGKKNVLIRRIQQHSTSETNYSNLLVKELKTLLNKRNLLTTGKKVELVKRLEENDAATKPPVSPQLFTSEFPRELQQEIMLNLDDKELTNICRTNKAAAEICRDESFWNLRIQKIYKVDLSKYKEKDTYRKIYNKLRKTEEKDEEWPENLILLAVKKGYLPLLKLIDKEENTIDSRYLETAAYHGRLEILEYILKKVENDEDFEYNRDESLITAAGQGHLDIVKYLIEQDANITTKDEDYTALERAAENGHLKVVIYLIEHGAGKKDTESRFVGEKDIAASLAAKNGYTLIVEYLIEEADADIKEIYDDMSTYDEDLRGLGVSSDNAEILETLIALKYLKENMDESKYSETLKYLADRNRQKFKSEY